jgi:predicted RNA-binding protein Jag
MDTSLLAFVRTFFTGLGITITTLTVDCEWDNIDIRIVTPDSALLIGMHGKSIESIQHLLSRLLEKQFENFFHVHLEVNDYMKQKDERLYQFLDSKIALVRSTGKELQMPSLTSYDRKKAHGYIAEKGIEWLSTKSEGEGSSRVMTLSYTWPITAAKTPRPNMTHVVTPRNLWVDLTDDGVGI